MVDYDTLHPQKALKKSLMFGTVLERCVHLLHKSWVSRVVFLDLHSWIWKIKLCSQDIAGFVHLERVF